MPFGLEFSAIYFINSQKIRSEITVTIKITAILTLLFITACSSQQAIKPTVSDIPVAVETNKQSSQSFEQIDEQLFVDALTSLQQNEIDKAKRLFNKFIEKYPELSGAYLNLALIHFKQQQYGEAMELTNRALSINSAQPQAYQLRAQLNIKNGKIKEPEFNS